MCLGTLRVISFVTTRYVLHLSQRGLTPYLLIGRLDILPAIGNGTPIFRQAALVHSVAASEEDDVLLLSILHLLDQALSARRTICATVQFETHGSAHFELLQEILVFFDCDGVDNSILLLFVFVCMKEDVQAGLHLLQGVVLVLLQKCVDGGALCVTHPTLAALQDP